MFIKCMLFELQTTSGTSVSHLIDAKTENKSNDMDCSKSSNKNAEIGVMVSVPNCLPLHHPLQASHVNSLYYWERLL